MKRFRIWKEKKNKKRKQRIKPCPVKRKNTIRKGIVHMYIYTYEVTTSKGLKTNNKSFSITATARSLTVGCRVSRGSCSRKSTLRRTKPCEEIQCTQCTFYPSVQHGRSWGDPATTIFLPRGITRVTAINWSVSRGPKSTKWILTHLQPQMVFTQHFWMNSRWTTNCGL